MSLLRRSRNTEEAHRGLARREGRREEMHGHGDWGLARIRKELGRTFDRLWGDLERGPMHRAWPLTEMPAWPAMDIGEDEKAVTIRADVPGLDAKDVDVELSGNLLTVRGKREEEWTDNRGGMQRRERRLGSFTRTITLPNYVEADKAEAKFEKGTLTVTLPKMPGAGPKRVRVLPK